MLHVEKQALRLAMLLSSEYGKPRDEAPGYKSHTMKAANQVMATPTHITHSHIINIVNAYTIMIMGDTIGVHIIYLI